MQRRRPVGDARLINSGYLREHGVVNVILLHRIFDRCAGMAGSEHDEWMIQRVKPKSKERDVIASNS